MISFYLFERHIGPLSTEFASYFLLRYEKNDNAFSINVTFENVNESETKLLPFIVCIYIYYHWQTTFSLFHC